MKLPSNVLHSCNHLQTAIQILKKVPMMLCTIFPHSHSWSKLGSLLTLDGARVMLTLWTAPDVLHFPMRRGSVDPRLSYAASMPLPVPTAMSAPPGSSGCGPACSAPCMHSSTISSDHISSEKESSFYIVVLQCYWHKWQCCSPCR